MDRRNSMATLFGKGKQAKKTTVASPPSMVMDLDPYTGPWTKKEAGHLLRRTTFGPDQEMINEVVGLGLANSLNTLIAQTTPSVPPLRYTLDQANPQNPLLQVLNDPFVPYGETWVNEPPLQPSGNDMLDQRIQQSRIVSVQAWSFLNMSERKLSLMPKMWMFWHNHFVVADFRLALEIFQYANLIERFALGDFKTLTKEMTILPAMLRYLNGNENTKEAPNENYARELLELFTVGKGDLAGPGDYTTFTEEDVIEIAKSLTGWTIDILNILVKLDSKFLAIRHEGGPKQLSHRFNNAVIQGAGADEYKNLIDVIFESDEVALFISRKLYRYFLNYEITAEIESNIIAPMAALVRENDYNIEPALKTLLASNHFFSDQAIGCMIKNPADFIISATRGLNLSTPGEVAEKYFFNLIFYVFATDLDMTIYQHPNVAGWKAYYQEPQFYRTWINSFTLPQRNNVSISLAAGGQILFNGSVVTISAIIPIIEYVQTIPNNTDPNELVYGIARHLFPEQITEGQKDYLKEILIPGLPDFEWSVEYAEFLADPTDPAKFQAINSKLQSLISAMLEMPEFQLM